jgi:hypothetical protein
LTHRIQEAAQQIYKEQHTPSFVAQSDTMRRQIDNLLEQREVDGEQYAAVVQEKDAFWIVKLLTVTSKHIKTIQGNLGNVRQERALEERVEIAVGRLRADVEQNHEDRVYWDSASLCYLSELVVLFVCWMPLGIALAHAKKSKGNNSSDAVKAMKVAESEGAAALAWLRSVAARMKTNQHSLPSPLQQQDDSLVNTNIVMPDYTYKAGEQDALINREQRFRFCLDRCTGVDPQPPPPQLYGQ